jgi:hypothetical protein
MTAASPPAVGTLSLSWKAPVANTDGSALTPLSGYGLYQGPSATALALVATLPPTQLSYTTPPLPAGHYYFAIEAIAADGNDSIMSNVVSGSLTETETPGAPSSVTISATLTASV